MTRRLLIPAFLMFLITGCSTTPEPLVEKAFFCDIEEKRKFTQEEIDWRAANAPWNLARDFRTNLAWEREECEDGW